MLFTIINLFFIFLILFPTMAVHFQTENEWKTQRKQAQPVINKIFSEMEKEARWSEQLGFLVKCRRKYLIPKGMRTKIPGKMKMSDSEIRMKTKYEMKILRKSISDLYRKKGNLEKNISRLKLDLRENHKLSGRFIENTINWLKKKVKYKTSLIKTKLKRKFQCLLEEKAKLEAERKQRKQAEKENKNVRKLDPRCDKKVVYNNSSRKLTDKEIELLSLGLNFGLAPKKILW